MSVNLFRLFNNSFNVLIDHNLLDLNIFIVKCIQTPRLKSNAQSAQHKDGLRTYEFLFKRLIFILL